MNYSQSEELKHLIGILLENFSTHDSRELGAGLKQYVDEKVKDVLSKQNTVDTWAATKSELAYVNTLKGIVKALAQGDPPLGQRSLRRIIIGGFHLDLLPSARICALQRLPARFIRPVLHFKFLAHFCAPHFFPHYTTIRGAAQESFPSLQFRQKIFFLCGRIFAKGCDTYVDANSIRRSSMAA